MKQEYKKCANKLTKIKSIATKKYYADELAKNKSNPQKTWELLDTLLPGKSTKTSRFPSRVSVNGDIISNEQSY